MAGVGAAGGRGGGADLRVGGSRGGGGRGGAPGGWVRGPPALGVPEERMRGLDPPQIREMRDVLTEYASVGRTVILSSH